MCAKLLTCPLCSQPGFLSLDALRSGLVSVATRPLACPVCNQVLLGIDKLTIHLFSHSINQTQCKTWSLNKPDEKNGDKSCESQNQVLPQEQVLEEPSTQICQDLGTSKPIIFIQGNEPLRIEEQDKMIFISERRKDQVQNQKNQLIILPKDQDEYQTIVLQRDHFQDQNNQVMFLPDQFRPQLSFPQVEKSQESNQEIVSVVPSTQEEPKVVSQIPVENNEKCDVCGFYFPDSNILSLHKQVVHANEKSEKNSFSEHLFKNYPCYLCSKIFKMRGSLMVHMRVAHANHNSSNSTSKENDSPLTGNENGFSCPTCGKIFKKEQHVTQHLKTHEGKQWECDVCSKMFTTKYFLKKHKRLHSGEMPYKCNICDKTFTFQQSYHKHRLYHKDDKPHTCTTCGRSFKELSTLHNHERIHTGEKPFACETCGKCFRQRVSYLVHRRIHTGVMPYKCTVCGKSFRYKVSQRTHKCPVQPEPQVEKWGQSSEAPTNIEENKYVLIVNDQGQQVLARESEIEATSVQNFPPSEPTKPVDETDTFFSMIMEPLAIDLSTPSTEMEHLRLSSPVSQNVSKVDEIMGHNYLDSSETLQTINEESLKELLYGINK